uniref:ATP synthase F0 subunit 8 n=1 Tax=Hydroptila angulata TaxID=1875522 RepID=UPI0022DCDDF5|nr:ATP synthase F0 subunit 8 [Hydroptila angulata]UZZ44042.1 ATP synthase F0 subunit 8 [Hydroptila angulata]
MPQMAPINWMFLFLFFLAMLLMFNILNYFNLKIMNLKTFHTNKINIPKISWKW